MCFCNLVGCCVAEPTKDVVGDWGGVTCSAGAEGEGMANGARVAEELD